MKFAILARTLLRPGFGVQTLLDCFLDGLRALSTEHEIVLLAPPNFEVTLPRDLQGVSIHKCGCSVTGPISTVAWDHVAAGWCCRKLGCAALFAPSHVTPLYAPIPVVTCIPDMMYELFPKDWSLRERAYIWLTSRTTHRFACRFTTISESSRADIIANSGISPDLVSVTYPGCPPGFSPADLGKIEEVRRIFDLQHPYFICIGSKHPRKNLTLLLEAYDEMRRDLSLDLVLTGNDFGQKDSSKLTLPPGAKHVGNISREDLPPLLSGSLALVFPSRYEGFGFPVLEAMACGAPVVATNVSSIPEIVGDAAILVPPDDKCELVRAMRFVATSENARVSLRASGIKRAAGFSNTAYVSGILRELETAARLGT